MRLEKIKLAGFKSFVDSTVIPFSSNFTGIVGPNGCGKSNVIDAVRWVLGESSARHLRGDQMADVIFNGSTSRKPVGVCFVELFFNNDDGRISGEFAAYNQISVKRQINRQGQSSYFLNGTRCRRKDITGLFLGTGLGPRSYAIIEQGTISRLIEAKPAELRLFLEEAAGISKYKERRRETENRIRRTRDNLNRLADVLEQVDKQCRHLKRQSMSAGRYKKFKAEERELNAQLVALRWQRLDLQASDERKTILSIELAVEKVLAEQREVETDIELQRSQQVEQQFGLNRIQDERYQVSANITKLEHTREHHRELNRARYDELSELQGKVINQQSERKIFDNDVQVLMTQVLASEGSLNAEQVQLKIADETLFDTNKRWLSSQSMWNKLSVELVESTRQLELLALKKSQLEQQVESFQSRSIDLAKKEAAYQLEVDDSKLFAMGAQSEVLDKEYTKGQDLLVECQQQLLNCRNDGHAIEALLAKLRGEHAVAAGRFESVVLLLNSQQEKVSDEVSQWLLNRGEGSTVRLIDKLDVSAGWEKAVDVVLGKRLHAFCVGDLSKLLSETEKLPKGAFSLFSVTKKEPVLLQSTALSKVVKSNVPMISLLDTVHRAESIDKAKILLKSLAPHESVITKAGVWLHADIVSVTDEGDEHNLLFLTKERKRLNSVLQQLCTDVSGSELTLKLTRERSLSLEKQLTELQLRQTGLVNQHAALTVQLNTEKNAVEQAEKGLQLIEQERVAVNIDNQQVGINLLERVSDFNKVQQQTKQLQETSEQYDGEQARLKPKLNQAEVYARDQREKVHKLQLFIETKRSSEALARQRSESITQQLNQAEAKIAQLQLQTQTQNEPFEKQACLLNELLQKRIGIEDQQRSLTQVSKLTETLIADLEVKLSGAEKSVQCLKGDLNHAEINHQEVLIRKQTLCEQIEDGEHELEYVLASLPADATDDLWQQKIKTLCIDINALGAVNLIAIDEYETQLEKKQYLDAQLLDLNESLRTLESAIGKIDKESRVLFQQTFDKVNAGFEQRFPKLFGGGRAYLQLTSNDLLETGVSVMARPPGKRNSSIHLLSGGEKALTAVALVFSIFDLNPSPLCLLDEVDAPLDEANVERFAEFVKDMSHDVQMILITHNKVTMERASQLAGVTMNEPGVSRLVTVDLESAAKMANG